MCFILLSVCARNNVLIKNDLIDLSPEIQKDERQIILIFRSQIFVRIKQKGIHLFLRTYTFLKLIFFCCCLILTMISDWNMNITCLLYIFIFRGKGQRDPYWQVTSTRVGVTNDVTQLLQTSCWHHQLLSPFCTVWTWDWRDFCRIRAGWRFPAVDWEMSAARSR